MICNGVAPIDWAASITPPFTSLIAVSTKRAKNGMAANVNGTQAAVVPIDVPATNRVKGIMATIKMMKGIDRVAFTMAPNTLLSPSFCMI